MPERTYGKKAIVIPDEHKEFVAELQNLFSKYPKAASRYGLADLGDNHVRTRVYEMECVELGGFTICEIKERPQ